MKKNRVYPTSDSLPTLNASNSKFEIKQTSHLKSHTKNSIENKYEKIFYVKNIWIILKGGHCIYEYHKSVDDDLHLNSILFGGFIYAIHTFAYQLIDQGLDKIRIHETEFKFIDFGDIILLSMVEEGLNELIVKNYLYKIGERFIKLYFDKISNITPEIKIEFTNEIDLILDDVKIRNLVVLSTIKELIIKVYNDQSDPMLFYGYTIELLHSLSTKEIESAYDEIKKFIDDLVKVDTVNTMLNIKNGFSQIVTFFLNRSEQSGLYNMNDFEENSLDSELINSLLNYYS